MKVVRLARLALVAALLAAACTSARYQILRAPAPRSLFARDPEGRLGEDDLQRLLASPIELDLPARVGVVPIVTAADWRGPSPDWAGVPRGTGALAAATSIASPTP